MVSVPRAFVVGWPISHSRSPLIHTHWLKTHGIAGTYDRIAVPPEDFGDFVKNLRRRGFVGGNVTIPHKAVAASLCGRLSETARRLGSVNTLWFEDDILCGDTTDGAGFLAALDQEAPGWDESRGLALVLGAGGASGPIVDALMRRGVARVLVANRTPAKARDLARRLGCEAIALGEIGDVAGRVDLLVNATSVGLKGQDDSPVGPPIDLTSLPPHAVVDDIVYVPEVTPLLAAARARGLRTVGGLGMLLHQAVPGFSRWFGVRPEVTPALRALVEADIAATAP